MDSTFIYITLSFPLNCQYIPSFCHAHIKQKYTIAEQRKIFAEETCYLNKQTALCLSN